MKKLLLTLLVLGSLSGVAQAKPGGWIKDFFQNNSVSYTHTQCSPAYYVERPHYYYPPPRPVIYERPTYYYCPPPQPRMIPMQPYQNHYYPHYR